MKREFFIDNRNSLAKCTKGGLCVVSAYTRLQQNEDIAFPFAQEANFWYLTGIEAPDWWVIIDGQRGKSWLVAPEVSDSHQIFDGSLSFDDAIRISGTDGVLTSDEAMVMLRDLAKKHSVVYSIGDHPHAKYFDFTVNPSPKKLWNVLDRIFNEVQDCRLDLAKLRAIKQPQEIAAIKKAVKLTVGAFKGVRQKLPTLKHEHEVEAEFSYYFRKNGARGHAYDPIVASGKNACTLHYGDNKSPLKKGDLLLIDIGARMNGYAADITRTYAVGSPTRRGAEVHAAVEKAHKQIIKLLKPNLLISEYQKSVDRIMKESLVDLGLMESIEDEDSYRKYFPHAISHGLGIDVHDSLGSPVEFLPGMVLTVEPGIYIPEEGIGVRIEDNILITETGHTNMSATLPTSL